MFLFVSIVSREVKEKEVVQIAHALGEIDGHSYMNCKEAYEQNSVHSGGNFFYFEVDVRLTSDGVPVCFHDLDLYNNMCGSDFSELSYEAFSSQTLYDCYSPIGLDYILEQMIEYSDLYFDLDILDNHQEILMYIKNNSLFDDLTQKEKNDIFDRLIIEFYSYEQYEECVTAFNDSGFSGKLEFCLHFRGIDDELFQYLAEKKIKYVAVPSNLLDEEVVHSFHVCGVSVCAYTVNDEEEAKYLESISVDSIMTDVGFYNGVEL